MELSVFVTIVIFVLGIVGALIKLFNDSAKVKIILRLAGRQSSPTRYIKYVQWKDSDAYDPDKSVMRYKLTWRLDLVLSNVSKDSTNAVSVYFYNDSPLLKIEDFINPEQVIEGHQEKTFHCKYELYQHSAPENRKAIDASLSNVDAFRDLKILLKYKVFLGIYRYTVYNHSNKTNRHYFFRPLRFQSHGNVNLPKYYHSV